MDERVLNKKLVEIGKRKDLVVTDLNITKDNERMFEGDFKARKGNLCLAEKKDLTKHK